MAGKSKKGRKAKKAEMPLTKPEPPELDEAECAMLWDHVSATKPNPLSPPGGPLYDYATNRAFHPGNPHPAIVGYLSPTIPLLSSNPGAKGIPPSSISAPPPATSPSASNAGSLAGAGFGFAPPGAAFPKPPSRTITPTRRVHYRLFANEKSMRDTTRDVVDLLEQQRGFWLLIGHEMCAFFCEKKELLYEKESLSTSEYFTRVRREAEILAEEQEFRMSRTELEERMDFLVSRDEVVQEALAEKRATLSERAAREEELFQLQRAHHLHVKQLTNELKANRDRLEEHMNQRLVRTTDEMAKVTATQREERQKRAQEESQRLVAELSTLEKRSKHLNDRSLTLQQQADATKRDRELEQHRRKLLVQKNHVIGEEVKSIVQEMQSLEQQIAEKQLASAAGQKAAHEQAMEVVDQQYENIAYLRTELEKVRADTESTRENIRSLQKTLLAEAGSKHLPITLPSPRKTVGALGVAEGGVSGGGGGGGRVLRIEAGPSRDQMSVRVAETLESLDDHTAAGIRAVILDAVRDTNDAMARLPVHGCDSIHALVDPTERILVQGYVARRVSKLLSCIYPSAPPFSFLKTAAKNPSSLATGL